MFNEQKVKELLLDLLDILKTVHQQKVIHRDIKPENIIRHSDGKLVLIDFGASKQLTATVMTNPGTAIGSFGYAPPEQMQGGEVYPASDLYSLGATCFHLLSGIHPWELWKRQGYGWVASWREHLQQGVSQNLGCVLDKLLQEEYQQRYQSATGVLQDLNPLPPPPSVPLTQPVILTLASPSPSPQPYSVAISPDGKTLVSGSWDKTIKLWNLATGKEISTLIGHSSTVNSVAISPDGKTLASGSGGGDFTIKFWNLSTGEEISTLHSGSVKSLAISSDGKMLVSYSSERTWKDDRYRDEIIKIWQIKK